MFLVAFVSLLLHLEAAVVVETSFGNIYGHKAKTPDGQVCEAFLGIPFAEPPLRFTNPTPWTKPFGANGFVANQYGAWCPQKDGADISGSEDCLFLNIWRPKGSTEGSKLTMMVWIFGGGFSQGDDGDRESPNTYDGCGLAARHGIIVAGMNYRVGPLGFLALDRPDGGLDANYGIEDQREALRWLRKQAFGLGGDASKITIFGESAGAMSVFHHIASTKSAGLFRAAISESGLPFASSRSYCLNTTRQLAVQVGCNASNSQTLRACLKSKSSKELIKAIPTSMSGNGPHFGPAIDGVDLLDHPKVLFAHNRTRAVPLLAGSNTDEANVFLWPEYPDGLNISAYHAFVTRLFTTGDPKSDISPQQLAEVFKKYPATSSGNQLALAATVFTDFGMLCGTRNALTSLAARTNVFMYRFDHRPTCPQPNPSIPGAYHEIELPYVFATPRTYNCSFTVEERSLSARIQRYWANFAKHLNPAPDDHTTFPAFSGARQKGLVFRAPSDVVEDGYRADYCSFWFNIYRSQREQSMREVVI